MPDENLVKQLVAESQCEGCGRFYEAEDISILGHCEDVWVLQVNCGACHSQAMLAALIDEDEDPQQVEALSDLTETEIEKFAGISITSDDVLDTLNFFSGFKGDFSQLFEQG